MENHQIGNNEIEDKNIIHLDCNDNTTNNMNSNNEHNHSHENQKNNSQIGLMCLIAEHRKIIVISFALIAVVCFIVAICMITSSKYSNLLTTYEQAIDWHEESLKSYDSNNGHNLVESFDKYAADSFKQHADNILSDLTVMRIQAIGFALLGLICGIISVITLKAKK